ncbi:MAG: phosphoribosylamine--glycine ligase, partial [Caldimonas sp.]
FGPTRAAAQLESSKAYAKDFMRRHRIPTAAFETFDDAAAAHAHVDAHGAPIVVKADGLAAGKGVVVALTAAEAHAAIDAMLPGASEGAGAEDGAGSDGGNRVVIEEYLDGEEASFIVVCDGRNVVPLATSQDHKRLGDADTGPNTGGMGAYTPAPVVTPNVHARVMHEIVRPVLAGMAADGVPFSGFLYAGLMIDAHGQPRTVEFNCRLGDPETQVLMPRLKSDLFELLMQATAGAHEPGLDRVELQWDRRAALGVVMAAHGYPLQPRAGDRIGGLPSPTDDALVFHAGTAMRDGAVVTAGGRVLCVTALGDSVRLAQQRAYQVLGGVHFDGAQYRRDIGHRAIKRQ